MQALDLSVLPRTLGSTQALNDRVTRQKPGKLLTPENLKQYLDRRKDTRVNRTPESTPARGLV